MSRAAHFPNERYCRARMRRRRAARHAASGGRRAARVPASAIRGRAAAPGTIPGSIEVATPMEVSMEGANQRIDQFVEERLKQIDVSLTPAERRAATQFVPYFRWATDDELRELLQLLKRHAAGEFTGYHQSGGDTCFLLLTRCVNNILIRLDL
ncbi:hypothetical protein [Burkholderia ubonensis]|uniref:hypothetical protein n=1 Tax=Burkholderia ubonensis TaxID=101571 RepID=UPI001E56C16F|nr:hypothetical protein [Burkholderia ubonensis]